FSLSFFHGHRLGVDAAPIVARRGAPAPAYVGHGPRPWTADQSALFADQRWYWRRAGRSLVARSLPSPGARLARRRRGGFAHRWMVVRAKLHPVRIVRRSERFLTGKS